MKKTILKSQKKIGGFYKENRQCQYHNQGLQHHFLGKSN